MLVETSSAPPLELGEARRKIREYKESAKQYETNIKEHEAKLNQGLSLI